jgi:3-phenylpropionate/cinnamic acid dioxygenase small subunit
MDMQQLQDLEDIRQLKSRYFRLMDTQQWEAWQDCFTVDISAFYEGAPRASADDHADALFTACANVAKTKV